MLGIERRVGQMLVESGNISEEQLMKAIMTSERKGYRLRDVLYEENLASPYAWLTALTFIARVPFIDLAVWPIPETEALYTIPKYVALRLKALPLLTGKDYVRVVMDDPTVPDVIAELEMHASRKIRPAISYVQDLSTAIRHAYNGRWKEYKWRLIFEDPYTIHKTDSTSFGRN